MKTTMRPAAWAAMWVFLCSGFVPARAQRQPTSPIWVATYESIGVCWKPTQVGGELTCRVEYVEAGQSNWQAAQDLWFDVRTENTHKYYPPEERQLEYRGSIVGLEPDTSYHVRLMLMDGGSIAGRAHFTATTWSEDLAVDSYVYLPEVTYGSYSITTSGPGGDEEDPLYRLYTFDPTIGHATINHYGIADNPETSCIYLNASNVIIRGLSLLGGKHSIYIEQGCENVVVEDCEIQGWGRKAEEYPESWGHGFDGTNIGHTDGAICIDDDSHATRRIIVQNNRIHHPRWDSSHWFEFSEFPHPVGPLGIYVNNAAGNNVFRYNAFYGEEDHYFCDAICGQHNSSHWGCPGPNSDIHGNIITHVWDDGIEAEGGGQNVRIWSNYTDEVYTAYACSATSIGPAYLWRNLSATSRCAENTTLGGPFLKLAHNGSGDDEFGDGRIYVYHNTILQPEVGSEKVGCKRGIYRSPGEWVFNVVSRNNLLLIEDPSEVDPEIRTVC